MPLEPPPPRYRVVEQGRRLVVIDARTGEPASRPAPVPAPRTEAAMPGVVPATLRTLALFDASGPRTIRLSAAGQSRLSRAGLLAIAVVFVLVVAAIAFPPLVLAIGALLVVAVRGGLPLRGLVTRWLDALGETQP